jgi:hypothetical protein
MTGYVRKDTTNNIADGNVINAADLDNEFDGLQDAFNASTGHNHDGTTGEGAPILAVGPAQDVVFGASAFTPKTTNTVDVGSTSLRFKDVYMAGLLNGTLTLPTATDTLVGKATTDTLTNKTINLTSNTLSGTTAQFNTALSDGDFATLAGSETLTNKTLTSPAITGGTINNASVGATTPSTGAFTTLSASGAVTLGSISTISTSGADNSITFTQSGPFKVSSATYTLGSISTFFSNGATNGLEINQAGPTLIKVGGSTITTTSSTGLAVTGALSATNPVTVRPATNTPQLVLQQDNDSTSYSTIHRDSSTGNLVFGNLTAPLAYLSTSGNWGLGVTPSAWAASQTAIDVGGAFGLNASAGSNTASFSLSQNAYYNGTNWIYKGNNPAARYDQVSGVHTWSTAATGLGGNTITFTQAMTLDASGNLLIGTSSIGSWDTKLTLSSDSGTTKWSVGPYSTATNFVISASGSFGVYLAGTSATAWSSVSDEREKTDLLPIENAVQKVGTLRAVTGRYVKDETNTRKSFLIAQDVQAVLPEAVSVQDDEQGTLGLAYSDVIPLLVAAIKEQQAQLNQGYQMIQALEVRLAALEAK